MPQTTMTLSNNPYYHNIHVSEILDTKLNRNHLQADTILFSVADC